MKRLIISLIVGITLSSWFLSSPEVLAQTSQGVEQVNNFIENLIKIVAGIAGLIATGFFVLGGLSFITSSGNPVALEKAKKTLVFASLGLVIVIGAFALSGIINDLAVETFGS
ncbi:MAG: TrbC/VirB2 family protein [Candidatus Saccharibacteria bacterium]|nr:TrbC/VirB2 family protein [Candidatus Saccharibacteria bacterium]